MPKKKVSFSGFDGTKHSDGLYHKMKDFPPRELPRPIDTRPAPTWSIEVDSGKTNVGSKINNRIIGLVNLILPILGITLIVGGIAAAVLFVVDIY